MRVHAPLVVLELQALERVDCLHVRPLDSLLERRLEALAEEEHEIRSFDVSHLTRRQLEVVGLRPSRREIGDLDPAPADLLRGKGERVEACHDVEAAVRGVRAAAAAGSGHERGAGENDSRFQRC